ncbi:hypothetical protein [Bacillus infantis]|uniref:hypothetical protein n=1 Tax=Bacillus infantis TaxID=324767 RepID=UPI003CF41E48
MKLYKNYLKSMSKKKDLILALKEAGFEVEDGDGKIIFTEEEDCKKWNVQMGHSLQSKEHT